mmetsp:Transcript_23899/g.74727  ORF Transcript_23899/g.74727 Transcript_23899/m.74727 type:complete len:126 (+) Transcript_23899:233-610(+)
MADIRALEASRNSAPAGSKKDKLAETKRAEREVKDALKAQRDAKKQVGKEARAVEAELAKSDRLYNGPTSKRAAKDARHAAKKDERQGQGVQVCEHGVNKCRICNAHTAREKGGRHRERVFSEEA